MERLAIVGTGIAGMACGYFLHRDFDLTVYEQNDYIGGHTHTIDVSEQGAPISIDTGFVVYNEITYPHLTRLFRMLHVETIDAPMSFSVNHVPSGLEWCGSGLNGLFGQRKNLFRPKFYRLLLQVRRFNTESVLILDNPRYDDMSVSDFVREGGYGTDFLNHYLIPMSSAVWSAPPDRMLSFPAQTLVRFFRNHGFLGLTTQHQWRTVVGGSKNYRDILIKPFRERIFCRRAVHSVEREGNVAVIKADDGTSERFDKVVLACHADQALRMLAHPTQAQRQILETFPYQSNDLTLHTDPRVMPRTRRTWSSWNYRIDSDEEGTQSASTIYYMNSLQKVSRKVDYFISINDAGIVSTTSILRRLRYEHPLYTTASIRAQRELPSLNVGGPVYFCGSYFRYGFHEDALVSAMDLCLALTGRPAWQ